MEMSTFFHGSGGACFIWLSYPSYSIVFNFFLPSILLNSRIYYLARSPPLSSLPPCSSISLIILFKSFLNVHVNYLQTKRKKTKTFFFWQKKSCGSTDGQDFVLNGKQRPTTKTFATICALYVYVCTEVFLFTVKWPFIIMEKETCFCIVIIKTFIASHSTVFRLFWWPMDYFAMIYIYLEI